MPLSRLENFLRNPKGSILYVDPNNFDATDSFDNRGDSATRPFKTIQRALIEASRFSYQIGINNDLNDRTTILVSSGVHYIDNRPGLSVTNSSGTAVYKRRAGQNTWTTETLSEFNENSNFDIFSSSNDLYKFNSTEGGVILPRGTSIVGLDLRKTKIRPLYVPNPTDTTVDRSSIFKITGNCYFTAFTFFDADPSVAVYNDYTNAQVNPRYSHHKLTAFTYADGINKVKLGYEQTNLTDLEMYYHKIANAYGNTSGRDIPDYPSNLDFEANIDEYRIVGPLEENLLGISSIRSGDGTGSGLLNNITVTTKDLLTGLEKAHNLNVNTPILISGISVSPESYNGSFIVNSVVGPNTFTYIAQSVPTTKLPSPSALNNSVIKVESDTVSSSSPYIFNCSLRSAYGMCGLWADGNKSDGFKSVVVAQFTGISLQKDDNAFLIYSKSSNNYLTSSQLAQESIEKPLHTNPYSIYRPDYENFHIKVSNNGFIQCVSIFAIGFSKHFVTETGGDMSITNSNSNFGALALESYGFRNASFNRDDVGYITHIIPPRELNYDEVDINWLSINVALTLDSSNSTTKKLYLVDYTNVNSLPPSKIDGYRIGARNGDLLKLVLSDSNVTYTSPILMQSYSGVGASARKEYKVSRTGNQNSINSDTITLETQHQFISGEKVRIFSNTGQAPDGLSIDTIYYVIRINSTTIKLAYNYNDAIASIPANISGISNNGGILTIVSTVSDKKPGEVGHPIQYDQSLNNWYVISSNDSSNQIYNQILSLGQGVLGKTTASTYFSRQPETRSIEDRLYKIRYVIPKDYTDIKEPSIGYVLQESKTVGVTTTSITSSANLKVSDKRNEKIISSITAGTISNNSQVVTARTEAAHKLLVGDVVKVQNVKSTYNTTALGITSTFNGSYKVLSIIDSHSFTYAITGVSTNPGAFINDLNTRNQNTIVALPVVSREQFNNTFSIYRVDTIKNHIPGVNGQDGVYHITMITSNVGFSDNVGYGLSYKKFNQDVRNLYPQTDRDNYLSDPEATSSFADYITVGKVVTNDKKNSITKEALEYFVQNNNIGFGITGLTLSGIGSTTITINTSVEHKLNSIKSINLTSGGSGQSGSYYGANIKIGSNITDATCNYATSGGAIVSSSIEFIDFGSAFGVGQTIGIGTLGGVATITEINLNINDGLEISGFLQKELNGVFKILSVPNNKTIILQHPTGISTYVANTNSRIPFGFISSKGIGITSFAFTNISTGIVTVTTSNSHGLLKGNNFTVIGSGSTIYDSNFIVDNVINLTSFSFNVGIANTNPSSTVGILFRKTLAPNGTTTGRIGENLGYRTNYIYAGISTTLTSLTDTQITLTSGSGFNRGDYVQVGSEIIRLVKVSSSNIFNVERAMFGTLKELVSSGTVVQKIKVIPIELRRPSYLRASGHTFEYLGYGPGNYSTAVPQKQSRKLSDDDILVSQSREISGGTVVYSGMNDLGEFYSGSKKLNSASGQETIVEAPIITFTGDDVDGSDDPTKLAGIFDTALIRQRLTVEGGDNGTESSIFYGPVRFQNGININGDFSVKSLLLNNKKFTVNDKTGTVNQGAISYTGVSTSYIGEIYLSSGWRRWGLISKSETSWDVDLGESSSLKTTNLEVTGILTINGIGFNGTTISSLELNKLSVSGISTLKGGIYGDNNILKVYDNLDVGSGLSTTRINSNGRTIDVGLSPTVGFSTINLHNDDSTFPQYGLRITRNSGAGSVKSQILHRGNQPLEIKTEDVDGTINLTNAGISTLSLTYDGVVSILGTKTNGGTGGAHLSIRNLNTGGGGADAVLSWRSGTNSYWYGGVNADDNSWRLAYSEPGVSLNSSDFNNTTTKIKVDENGDLTIPGKLKLIGGNTIGSSDVLVDGGTDGWWGLFNQTPGGRIYFQVLDSNSQAQTLRFESNGIFSVNNISLGTGAASNFYGDSANLALRTPISNGGIYLQSANGAQTFASFAGNGCVIAPTLNIYGVTNIENTLAINNNNSLYINGGDMYVSGGDDNYFAFDNTRENGSIHLRIAGGEKLSIGKDYVSINVPLYINSTFAFGSILNANGGLAINNDTNLYMNGGDLYVSGGGDARFNFEHSNGDGSFYFIIGGATKFRIQRDSIFADVPLLNNSDRKLKENITPILNALSKVSSISGNNFNWSAKSGKNGSDVGVIAQEVLAVLPEAVVKDKTTDSLYVCYDKLIPLLVEAVKELKSEVDELKSQINK
jgi:hypothetical protein